MPLTKHQDRSYREKLARMGGRKHREQIIRAWLRPESAPAAGHEGRDRFTAVPLSRPIWSNAR